MAPRRAASTQCPTGANAPASGRLSFWRAVAFRFAMPLDDECADATKPKLDGERQPGRPGADDEHIRFRTIARHVRASSFVARTRLFRRCSGAGVNGVKSKAFRHPSPQTVATRQRWRKAIKLIRLIPEMDRPNIQHEVASAPRHHGYCRAWQPSCCSPQPPARPAGADPERP